LVLLLLPENSFTVENREKHTQNGDLGKGEKRGAKTVEKHKKKKTREENTQKRSAEKKGQYTYIYTYIETNNKTQMDAVAFWGEVVVTSF
jgi:hypothetical protein